jgi:hypothetical protein
VRTHVGIADGGLTQEGQLTLEVFNLGAGQRLLRHRAGNRTTFAVLFAYAAEGLGWVLSVIAFSTVDHPGPDNVTARAI